eukprot:jgi/Tetstr1/459351/TSEL_004745.t1
MFKGEEEVWEVTPQLHGFVGMLKQHLKRPGGIIKHNTNAVKNLAATQTFPGDKVDEGSSSEPPAKWAKQPAKPAFAELLELCKDRGYCANMASAAKITACKHFSGVLRRNDRDRRDSGRGGSREIFKTTR